MRRILAGIGVLLLGLAATGVARADQPAAYPYSPGCGDECKPRHGLLNLWPFGGHKDPCQPGHSLSKLWPLSGHKLSGHPGQGHCAQGGCGYHPWFNTFKPCPEGAFPTHPFVRSPRDFFMYEW